MTERGFIALARGILDHQTVGPATPYSDFEAWVWLLFEAAYKPRGVRLTNGRAVEIVQLTRGQITHSLRYMAKAWGWSDKRVRTFLYRLKTDAQIDTQTGHVQTVITIRNYELYQGPEAAGSARADAQTDAQRTRKGRKEETRKQRNKKKVHARQAVHDTKIGPNLDQSTDEEPVNEPPKAKLFRTGKTLLVSLGISENRSGAILGRWLKQKNDPQGILAALQWAADHGVIEPIGYVTRLLAKDANHGKTKSAGDRALELAEQARELERAAGIGRPPGSF